ncbi:MAG: hypothetical protein FWD68_08750 [Alphaproteobacteria bacterium]|nr:hypothetical protein [Alphaproteobacteria bacterium]
MLPDIVTFWHGPMNRLRQTCLNSQLAAGHKVTVYAFQPLPDLPPGVLAADAETILPFAFAERLRPQLSDGSWDRVTILQFADFFRMKLQAKGAGLWLDTDVLLLKPVEIDAAKPYFAWQQLNQLGNSVLYLPAPHAIVAAFEKLMAQDSLTPDWMPFRHRLVFALHRMTNRSIRISDTQTSIFGSTALTALARRFDALEYALPKHSFYAVHAEPRRFFAPSRFQNLIDDPRVLGLHISSRDFGNPVSPSPVPGSLHAWATEQFG